MTLNSRCFVKERTGIPVSQLALWSLDPLNLTCLNWYRHLPYACDDGGFDVHADEFGLDKYLLMLMKVV